MLKIAVCDDEISELYQIEIQIKKYAALHPELNISYTTFQSSEALLSCLHTETFQIYLLDIIMDGKNGIAMGNAIRDTDEEAVIIYTTVSPDYAIESYTVAAFYYLLKPISEEKLYPVLDNAFKHFNPAKKYLSLRIAGATKYIPAKKVVIIEYHSHCLSYHMDDGALITSQTFRESFDQASEPILKNSLFRKISSSYIVNLAQIERVTKRGFLMRNGAELTVSRLYSDVKKDFAEFMVKEGHKYDF